MHLAVSVVLPVCRQAPQKTWPHAVRTGCEKTLRQIEQHRLGSGEGSTSSARVGILAGGAADAFDLLEKARPSTDGAFFGNDSLGKGL